MRDAGRDPRIGRAVRERRRLRADRGRSPARTADTGDGFDWVSALVGAGAALALAALGSAALLTFRRRTAVSPSPSAS